MLKSDVIAAPSETTLAAPAFASPGWAFADLDGALLDSPSLAPDLADTDSDAFLECVALADVPRAAWSRLAERAIEPNAFYDPVWARAVSTHASDHQGAKALLVWNEPARKTLIGLLPVRWAWTALKLPLRVLVAWEAYARLTTPLLDRDAAERAAGGLLDAAAAAGARALLLPDLATAGPAADAFRQALASRGIAHSLLRQSERAFLAASGDGDKKLYAALGPKKLKELRRQRHRLTDDGVVSFETASDVSAVTVALEQFLALEMAGWKGRRGTALAAHPGDVRFIRQAAIRLAARGRFEVVTLTRGGLPIAAGLVLRQARRAYFFKIAFDENLSRLSPGVQITLDLTRHFCAHAGIDDVDSTADADHPMIDHVWRDRFAIGDAFIPTRTGESLAPAIRALIMARSFVRERAARLLRQIRIFRERAHEHAVSERRGGVHHRVPAASIRAPS